MPASARGDELIQRYLDGQASPAELVELERLLTTEPAVAEAFAQAMRLEASLQAHFQRQCKIDQVARLLEESATSTTDTGALPDEQTSESPLPPAAAARALAATSIFVPQRGLPLEPRRPQSREPILRLPGISRRGMWIAAALLLLVAGAVTWHSTFRGSTDQPRVVSGSVVISGREVATILDAALFDVVGREPAIIDLPEGARIKLDPATQASIHHDGQQTALQIVTGGGLFHVPSDRAALQIETPLGRVSTTGGRFSVILISPVQISMTEPVPVRQLAIVVESGSVMIERDGVMTTLSAGDERVFL